MIKENKDIQDIERIEAYVKKRYRTGQAFDNLINNIKQKQKKRYMNIKLKAALTVIVFFGGLTGMMVGLLSLDREVLVTIFKVLVVTVALAFAYKVALDYYKADKELKDMQRERMESNKRLEEVLGDISDETQTHVWTYDDGASIRPPRGRRLPKKGESTGK